MDADRWGLLCYQTWNIGDEIQSLAAAQFLPRIDTYVDRDDMTKAARRLTAPTKVVMNGWWLHGSDWPPADEHLRPKLTSMFIDHGHPHVRRAFLSPRSRDFLKRHGPVGARDLSTLEFLRNEDVDAYFSGCLTLTLRRDPGVVRQPFVLAVDLPADVVAALRRSTDRPVVELSVYHDPDIGVEARFHLARIFLLLYQSAAVVVSTRLHAVLPSTAVETPTVLVRSPSTYDPSRFSGLDTLVRSVSLEQARDLELPVSLDEPTPNPTRHALVRDKLIGDVAAFTGQPPVALEVSTALQDPAHLHLTAEVLGGELRKAHDWRLAAEKFDRDGNASSFLRLRGDWARTMIRHLRSSGPLRGGAR